MNYLLSAPEEKLNKEAFGELPGPRGIIVSSLCGSPMHWPETGRLRLWTASW